MPNERELEEKASEALDLAFKQFEKENGRLNDNSDFDLFGKCLNDAIYQFNQIHGTNFDAEEIINKQSGRTEPIDELALFMEEALENWNNLNR